MLSPVRASVLANSSGGSRCENRTCGAVCDALRPSFNSCMNTLPNTTSSSSRKIVLNTTVTLSALASTYLRVLHFRCTQINKNKLFTLSLSQTNKQTNEKNKKMQQKYVQRFIFSVIDDSSLVATSTSFLKIEIFFEHRCKTITF